MVVKKEVVVKSFFFAAWILIWVCLYPLHGLVVILCRMCMPTHWSGVVDIGAIYCSDEKPLVISWSIDNLFRCGRKHSSRISYHGSMLLDIHLLSHERRACKMFWPRAMMDEPWNARHAKCFDHASWWMSHECRACRIFWPCAMHGIFNYPLLVKLQQERDFRGQGHSWNMHVCLLMWARLSFL